MGGLLYFLEGAGMTARACATTGCLLLSYRGEPRCATHTASEARDPHRLAMANARKSRHAARRNARPGDGAASRMRYRLRADGFGYCALCGDRFAAGALEVDHEVPLLGGGVAGGGGDFADNVRPVCRPCHLVKTRSENKRPSSR